MVICMGNGIVKVFSSGVFDVLNIGHINILTKAKSLGDFLIVAIQSDEYVKTYKGNYPILDINERVNQIRALPFVDDIIVYGDSDQREIWDNVKPDIIVQGDDYIHSGDRTLALEYIKKNNIRLCLLPRTEGISSTEIKNRILDSKRKDLSHLKNLDIIPINSLSIYEEYEESKVLKLIKKIESCGTFYNPIVVGKMNDLFIIVDGVNRYEALKRLNCNYIPALILPYEDIVLTSNTHFLNDGVITRLSEFSNPTGEKITFEKRSHTDIYNLIKSNKMIPSGETWHKPPYHIINFIVTVDELKTGLDINKKIEELIKNNSIRYYPSSIYTCNEW